MFFYFFSEYNNKDATSEKIARAALKSAVDHAINQDTLVILDSMNYIKGYRYELFCLARGANTQHCVIWCETNLEKARKWNATNPTQFSDEL